MTLVELRGCCDELLKIGDAHPPMPWRQAAHEGIRAEGLPAAGGAAGATLGAIIAKRKGYDPLTGAYIGGSLGGLAGALPTILGKKK